MKPGGKTRPGEPSDRPGSLPQLYLTDFKLCDLNFPGDLLRSDVWYLNKVA